MSSSMEYYSSSEALELTDNLPPNPTLLIFALALTISLYPLIDYTLHLLLVISSFKPQPRQRSTTHRDLLLLYLTIILTSLAIISLWHYWYGGPNDNNDGLTSTTTLKLKKGVQYFYGGDEEIQIQRVG